MARAVPIDAQSDGINLLRSKGGASPQGLFDLLNGYVTAKKTINARPGSVSVATFPAGTFGVVGFEGKFHTFSTTVVANSDPNVVVHVLKRSDNSASPIAKVHRAFAFLGRLYVVAEFADGAVRHFWLDGPGARASNKIYSYGARVTPSTGDNGFYYAIEDADPAGAWTNGLTVQLNDIKQPTAPNGFKYQVTAVNGYFGSSGTPEYVTGDVEPTWPTTEGATVTERRFATGLHIQQGSGTPGAPSSGASGTGSEYGPFPPKQTTTKEPSSGGL